MQGWPQRHRISVEHFYRMADAGLFDADERVELVDGEIIDVPPMGSRHATVAEQLTRLLGAALPMEIIVRSQLPVSLGEYSELLPDIAIARPRSDRYGTHHPTAADVLLLVEVSDSTLRYDREIKSALYARHGVPELWIVDVQAKELLSYRSPVAGRYMSETRLPLGRMLVAATGIEIDLAALLIAQPV
jgi:Uma2 family endonuclease